MDQKKKNKGLSELIDAACSFKKQLEQLQKDLKLNNCFSQIAKLQTDYQRQTGQLQLPTTYFMALEAHKRVNPLFEMVKRTLGAPLDQFKEAAEALAKQNFAIQSSFREKLLQALPETYEASGALKEAQSVLKQAVFYDLEMIHKAVTSSSFGVMNLEAFISANNLQTPEAIAKIANSEKLNTKDSVKFKEIATAIKDKLFAHNQLECNSNKKNIITPPKAVPESQNQRINNIMLILAFLSVVGDFIVQPLVSLYPNEARAMIERSKQIFLPLEKNLKHIVKTSKKIGVCLTKTNINVKTKPGKNSKTFLKLPPHTPVVVFDSYKRWNRIGFRINGQAIEGFCENKNLHELRARQE